MGFDYFLILVPYYNDGGVCTKEDPDNSNNYQVVNQYLPNGLLNVSSCKFNSAAYVSFPHFYLADPALLEQFDPESDLNPNEEEHSAHLTILPQQGIPLDVAIRMQINVLYRPITCHVPLLENTTPTFYPAVWFEVSITILSN